MRYLLFLVIGAAACAGSTKSTGGATFPMPATKATSEMGESDPDLRPVAIAAAGYYKRVTPSARLGFFGVYLDQLEVPRVTEEVVRRYNFTRNPRLACVQSVLVPAGSARPVTPPAGTPQNCRMEGADAAFALNGFRRVADTVYVGGSETEVRGGRPTTSDMCLVMVWRDTAWTGAGRRGVASRSCGR
jgi:hypothetical protein